MVIPQWTESHGFDDLYQNRDKIQQAIYNDSLAIWEREDSAYQRMVADMKKAGLNPWSAISSGGSPTSSTNPSFDSFNGLFQALSTVLSATNTDNRTANAVNQTLNTGLKIVNSLMNPMASLLS